MRGLYWCMVFILGTIYASLIVPYEVCYFYECNGGLEASASYVRHEYSQTASINPIAKMDEDVQTRFIASTSQINTFPPLHTGEGRAEARPYRGDGDTILIYIHTATQTITAYDPQADTHTPIFTCPEACYDPSTDQNGRIGFVTASGFGIFDMISGDYTQLSADFGVYGYKGGAAFRSDLALVAYEGRFDMQMRLLLTDLSTGETTDLGSSGVGNPAWSWDGQAVLVSDGFALSIVPINGDDPEMVEFDLAGVGVGDLYKVDLFQSYDAENWFFRGINESSQMGLYVGNPKNNIPIFTEDFHSALITYSITDTLAGVIVFSPRGGNYTIAVVDISFVPVQTRFCNATSSDSCFLVSTRHEITDIALSPDNQYVAWLSENPDMGFGFYDLWIADLSAPSITPTRIAEQISNPGSRPSGLTWMRG